MDTKIIENITEYIEKFINLYLECPVSNRLEVSFSNDMKYAVKLKSEELLLVVELYYYDHSRWVKIYVTSSIKLAIMKDKQCKDDLIWEIARCLVETSMLKPEFKLHFDDNNINYEIKHEIPKTYEEYKYEKFHSNKVCHKIPKNTKMKQIISKMIDLILDNDIVMLSFKARNEYLDQDMYTDLYLEKRISISGIEVVYIYVTRNMDDKVVIISDKCVDSVYSTSQKESIKDAMDIQENRKAFTEVLINITGEVLKFMNYTSDKGTKKYSLYSFKEEN